MISQGFGLLGPVTEGAYQLSPKEAELLKETVLQYASSLDFIDKSGIRHQPEVIEHFLYVLG